MEVSPLDVLAVHCRHLFGVSEDDKTESGNEMKEEWSVVRTFHYQFTIPIVVVNLIDDQCTMIIKI